MTRVRLRPAYTDADLEAMYVATVDRIEWPGHAQRKEHTAAMVAAIYRPGMRVADLSCGDGEIARLAGIDAADLILGDLLAGHELWGPIEQTIELIEPVDLFICSETLEHIDDPDALLVQIRAKTSLLLLSTPCNEVEDNPEHYWRWNQWDVGQMLANAGFNPLQHELLVIDCFTFVIWMAN